MGGNNDSFENFERNKYLKKLPSMQRVNWHDACGLTWLCVDQEVGVLLVLRDVEEVEAVLQDHVELRVLQYHSPVLTLSVREPHLCLCKQVGSRPAAE